MPLTFKGSKSPAASNFARWGIAVFAAISLVLVTVSAREGETGPLRTIQSAAHALLQPLTLTGVGITGGIEGATSGYAEQSASPETLAELKEQNEELTRLLAQAEEYRQEAERLQSLLGLKDTYGIQGVSGRVTGRSTDAWNQTLTIDIGSDDDVEPGLTVVGPNGVVGQVVSVAPGHSIVRLLTDPQSGCAAIVQSTRAEGIVRGSLSGLLYLENIEASVQLEVGDVVLTSGLGGSYVKGLLIGTIVRIDGNAADGSRTVIVSPNNPSTALEEVMVVFDATGTPSGDAAQAASTGAPSQG